jgi:hypothetical protein
MHKILLALGGVAVVVGGLYVYANYVSTSGNLK